MRKINVICCICLITILTACGSESNIDGKENIITYVPNKFEISHNTIRNKDEADVNQQIHNENFVKEDIWVDNPEIGEIIIEDTDNTHDYTIEGNNIIYNNIKYNNLYDIINNLDSPFDSNTFINFIIKNYSVPGESEVFCKVLKYNDTYSDEADSVDISVDELFEGHLKYEQLKAKYNEPATWEINIYTYGGKNNITICGCSRYVFLLNLDSDLSIKMQDYIDETETLETETLETETLETETLETETLETELDTSEKETNTEEIKSDENIENN